MQHIHEGEFIAEFPLIPGHETVGVVVAVGHKVRGFRPNDRVVADNSELCNSCFYCRRGEGLMCENVSISTNPITQDSGQDANSLSLVDRPRHQPARRLRRVLRLPAGQGLQDRETDRRRGDADRASLVRRPRARQDPPPPRVQRAHVWRWANRPGQHPLLVEFLTLQ